MPGPASMAGLFLIALLSARLAHAAEPCAGIAKSLFVDTLLAGSPTAQDSASPNRRLGLGFTFANTGVEWLSLQNLAFPVVFSMRVLGANGVWNSAPPSDFLVSCWTLETVDASGTVTGAMPCANVGVAALTNGTLTFTVTQPVQLCPGCGMRGAWGDTFIALQHKSNAMMERLSLAPGPPTCSGRVTSLKTALQSQPDLGIPLSLVLARGSPACAPWFASKGAQPAAPTPAQLSQLSLATSVRLTTVPSPAPTGVTFPNGQGVVEALLSITLRNLGTAPISLLGVRIPLSFSSSVLVPTSPPLRAAGRPEDFIFDCFGGSVTNAAGARADGDTDACRYARLQPPAQQNDTWALVFSGGSLCARCTLSGAGANGAIFNVKRADYGVMNASTTSFQPSGPATVTIPSAPPAYCGVPGAPAAPPAPRKLQPRCPLAGDVSASLIIRPYPAATADTDWFEQNTELRIVPSITNLGSTPLQLSSLKVNFSFDFRADAGPSAGFIRRPPSEFSQLTCFFGGVGGPQPDSRSLCDFVTLTPIVPADAELTFGTDSDDGAPGVMQLSFSAGAPALCPGCTLSGGSDGVFSSLHHSLYMPMAPNAFVPVALACEEALVLPAVPGAAGLPRTMYKLPLPPSPPPIATPRVLRDTAPPVAAPSPPPSCPWYQPVC